MFAGAAREAVFSNPAVIRRVKADFVPVALKAGLVNNPPAGLEGRLYREIGRSKPAPQGICVANSAGKVLDWALMFDDDRSVVEFLDYCLKRFAKFPDANKPVAAERYMRFPSQKLADVADTDQAIRIADGHAKSERCPAKPALKKGTLVGRVIGRTLDKAGKLTNKMLQQEHYLEARFEIPVSAQSAFAEALHRAGSERFTVPAELSRALVSNAYLGQLDVNPLGGRRVGGQTDRQQWQFWAQRVVSSGKAIRVRVDGKSDVAGGPSIVGRRTDGRHWEHEVKLAWEGYVDVQAGRITQLAMSARGNEKLRWGNRFMKLKGEAAVRHLPGGHPINLNCGVRYGMLAEPCSADEVVETVEDETGKRPQTPGRPNRARPDLTSSLIGMLGPRFVVLQENIWRDLKLSDKQKQQFHEFKKSEATSFTKLMREMQALKPGQRPQKIHAVREKANDRLNAELKRLLNSGQRARVRQLELQQQGLFALSDPEVAASLGFRNDQRRKFAQIVQEMQRRIRSIQQKAQSARNPRRLQQEAQEIREEQEKKIADLLSIEQQQKWKELTGKPIAAR